MEFPTHVLHVFCARKTTKTFAGRFEPQRLDSNMDSIFLARGKSDPSIPRQFHSQNLSIDWSVRPGGKVCPGVVSKVG